MWVKEENPILDETKAEVLLDKSAFGNNAKVELGKPIFGHWWHYERDGEIICYVWLREKADIQRLYNQPGDETPEIGIAVRPKYQKKAGYGYKAAKFGITQAQKMGYPVIFGKIRRENPQILEQIKLGFAFGCYGLNEEGHLLNLEETLQYAKQVALLTLKKDLS